MHRSLIRLAIALALSVTVRAATFADTPDDPFAAAAKAYSQQQWPQASQLFEKWLAENGQHPRVDEARFFCGEALAQLDRWPEARQQFQALLAHAPEHRYARQALFRSGEAAFLAGDWKSAQPDLQAFAKQFPDDPLNGYVQPYLASMALEAGQFAQAKQSFAAALERFQDGPLVDECRLGLARCERNLGELDEARRGLRSLAAGKGPLADQALMDLATLENRAANYSAAATALDELATRFPKSPLSSQARLAQGYAVYKLNRFEDAEKLLTPLLTDAERGVDAHYWLGLSQKAQSQWAAAARTLSAGAAAGRDHRLSLAMAYHAGDAELHDHQLDAAHKQFAETLAAAPEGPWADDCMLGLVRIAMEQGKHDECLRLRDTFAKQHASSPLRGAVELAAAQSFAALEKYEESAQVLAALLADKPLTESLSDKQRAEAQRTLGLCYARLGRLEEADRALGSLDASEKSAASGADARYQLAEAAFAAEKWDTAADQFSRLAGAGNPPELIGRALSGLGWSQLKAERWTEAAAAFNRLLTEFPASPLAAEAAVASGRALEKLEQPQQALAMYQLVGERYAKSDRAAEALWQAGRLHEQLAQPDKAIEAYNQLIRDHASFAEIDSAIYRSACLLRAENQNQVADELLARLSRDFPASQHAYDATLLRAEQALAANRPEEAEELLGKIDLQQAPDRVREQSGYLRGRVLMARGQWKAVDEVLGPLCEQFPKSPWAASANYLMAEAAYRRGEFELAVARLEAIRSAQSDSQPWAATAELRRAQALMQLKRWNDAVEAAQQIHTRFADFEESYEIDYLIGRAMAAQADFAAARQAYGKVLSSPRGQGTQTAALAQWMIGESYFHQENFEAALAEYSRLDDRHPFPRLQAAALLQAAKCREHLQQWPAAVADYEKLLQTYPQSELCSEATSRLAAARSRLAGASTQRK